MKSPNILFLQVDQLCAEALAAYGNGICKAPNLEKLAREGVVYDRAYCNFPLCAPSRFSMATGQLCSAIGAYDNAAEMPAEIPTYAHYLRNMGYQTALSGKMHFIGPDQYHGFETRLTADLYPADFAWVPNWGNEGKRDTNEARGVTISGPALRTVQMDYDEEVTHQAIRHLYDMRRNGDDRPFFLQVSWTHPHEPYLCKPEFWDLYEGVDIPLPATPALPADQHDAHARRLLSDFGMLNFEFDPEDIRRARRAYFGAISYIDAMVGQILTTLAECGYDQNTAIVFASDHGEMLGERGMWFKKHFYEPSMRVPLVLTAPWITPGRVDTLVSLVDLLPTFCGLATGTGWSSDVEPLEGRDLTQIATLSDAADRPVFAEYLAEATPAPIFMIRQGRFKFVTSSADPDLLFDLEADPQERRNLADDPAHAATLARFRDMAAAKWDADQLTRDIVLSQKRRQLVRAAQAQGRPAPRWNHGEAPDQPVPWYRGQGSYNDWAFAHLPPKTDTSENF
jgi:choline-sulfatase